MENIENFIKQSLNCRSTDILNHIATTDPQYKRFARQIVELEEQLTKDLPKKTWLLIDKHREIFLQREALIVDLIYHQGVKDGADFRHLLQKLSTG